MFDPMEFHLCTMSHFLPVIFCVALSTVSTQLFSQQIKVAANVFPTSTQIVVSKGETYKISAEGKWQDSDFPPSDATGFKGFTAPMFFGMLLKPLPSQYYMKLCGKVGNWKFPIGISTEVIMKRDGELLLFANDAKGFFDNNSGILKVTLKKTN